MGTFDRIFGRQSEQAFDSRGVTAPTAGRLTDDQAVERYRYLLRTAPPEAIEQAHAEAFAQLTPEQRRHVLEGLSRELPPQERAERDDPRSLARMATRAELRQPGTLERAFGTFPGGLGGFVAVDFLSTVAGFVVGSAIAETIFGDGGGDQGAADGRADAADGGQGIDAADAGSDGGFGGDFGGDFGGGEF